MDSMILCSDYIIYSIIMMMVLVIYIYMRFKSRDHENIRERKVNDTIVWLYQSVNNICYHCDITPVYNITETQQITYSTVITDPYNIKGIIYLVIWDEQHGRVFNYNTLIYAILCEMVSVIVLSERYACTSNSTKKMLMRKAIDLGYYDPKVEIEPNYIISSDSLNILDECHILDSR